MAKSLTRSRTAYEDDFHAWLMEQAAHARAGRISELDLANIAEELEALGRPERRELESRLQQIVLRLLRLAYGPDQRPRRGRGLRSNRHPPRNRAHPQGCLKCPGWTRKSLTQSIISAPLRGLK